MHWKNDFFDKLLTFVNEYGKVSITVSLMTAECYQNDRKRGIPVKNIPERQKDILSIIASLDISPTMYRNAVEKYKAITKFLSDCGIEADMYPQGSFAFGTVVRPNAKIPLQTTIWILSVKLAAAGRIMRRASFAKKSKTHSLLVPSMEGN